ncbi:MAG: hypothetical protein ACXWXQ_07680 [Actinomycetota bacterium]
MRRGALLVLFVGLALLVAACGDSGAPSSPAQAAEEGIDIGSVTPVDLPAEFPGDLPLPDDATPVFAAETDEASPAVWFASAHPKDELTTFFDDSFADSDTWAIVSHEEVQASSRYSFYSVASESWTATIYVGDGGPGTDAYTKAYSFYVEAASA